jgi:hypothetical protein
MLGLDRFPLQLPQASRAACTVQCCICCVCHVGCVCCVCPCPLFSIHRERLPCLPCRACRACLCRPASLVSHLTRPDALSASASELAPTASWQTSRPTTSRLTWPGMRAQHSLDLSTRSQRHITPQLTLSISLTTTAAPCTHSHVPTYVYTHPLPPTSLLLLPTITPLVLVHAIHLH